MLPLLNRTPFEAEMIPLADTNGLDCAILMVKGSFAIIPKVQLAEQQALIYPIDQFFGNMESSSLQYPADWVPYKLGTDVMMHGYAYASNQKTEKSLLVSLQVGEIQKSVSVFGNRFWKSERGGSMTSVQPFEKIPLCYERAYGGRDHLKQDPDKVFQENRNPVGRGFAVAKGVKLVKDFALPNLEDPQQYIQSWKDQPPPATFAPIPTHWEPRIKHAGTYDEEWKLNRNPFLPDDFHPHFFNAAPPDLVTREYLQGGEPVKLNHASPYGDLSFEIPRFQFQSWIQMQEEKFDLNLNLDTFLLEPEENRFTIVWRAKFPCDRKIQQIQVAEVSILQSSLEL